MTLEERIAALEALLPKQPRAPRVTKLKSIKSHNRDELVTINVDGEDVVMKRGEDQWEPFYAYETTLWHKAVALANQVDPPKES